MKTKIIIALFIIFVASVVSTNAVFAEKTSDMTARRQHILRRILERFNWNNDSSAPSNLFKCEYRSGGGASDCYADSATADCSEGKVVNESICNEFDKDLNKCTGARGQCVEPSSNYCDPNRDCPDGYECVLNICIDSSYIRCDREGSDCADGFVCNTNGRCVRDPNTDDGNNGDSGGGGIRLENPLSASTFEEFIAKLINSLIIFAGPILALIIVIGGFRFVLAGADPKQKEGGKNMIKYGVIGFIIMISAWILVAILKGIF